MNRISTILIILSLHFSIPSLAQDNLFFIFLNSNPDREEISEEAAADLQKKHLDNIGHLYDEGQLLYQQKKPIRIQSRACGLTTRPFAPISSKK